MRNFPLAADSAAKDRTIIVAAHRRGYGPKALDEAFRRAYPMPTLGKEGIQWTKVRVVRDHKVRWLRLRAVALLDLAELQVCFLGDRRGIFTIE